MIMEFNEKANHNYGAIYVPFNTLSMYRLTDFQYLFFANSQLLTVYEPLDNLSPVLER